MPVTIDELGKLAAGAVIVLPERDPAELGLRGSFSDIQERRHSQALQEARNAVLDRMLAQRPLQESLGDMARRLEQINPQMLVSIMRLEQGRLRVLAAPSLPGQYVEQVDGSAARLGVGSCGHAAASGELTVVEDIREHPYWLEFREVARLAGLRACWSLPFKNDQGDVLGVFGIYHRRVTRPSADDIALVGRYAVRIRWSDGHSTGIYPFDRLRAGWDTVA